VVSPAINQPEDALKFFFQGIERIKPYFGGTARQIVVKFSKTIVYKLGLLIVSGFF